jgi:hypothetical protein
MSNDLERVAPPALPIPDAEYSSMSFGNFNNVLRLFFTRFVGMINDIISEDEMGGKYLHFPCGDFYSDIDQTAALVATEYLATFNQEHSAMGISVVSSTQITVENDGIYQFVFTGQLETSNQPATNTVVWAKKNGTEVPYSGRNENVDDASVITLNFFQVLETGDYVEFAWAVANTDIHLAATAPTGVFGGIPSASVSCALVSNS